MKGVKVLKSFVSGGEVENENSQLKERKARRKIFPSVFN